MLGLNRKKFKYCPLCTTLLQKRKEEGFERKFCPKCGFVHYLNPVPAVAVIIEENGRVLLVKRKFNPWKGLWQCPAGFIEWDENPQQTAVREVEEETGLKVELTGIFDVGLITEDPRENIVIIFFTGKIKGGSLKAGDDAAEVSWFLLTDLPKFGSRQHKKVLEKLKNALEKQKQ